MAVQVSYKPRSSEVVVVVVVWLLSSESRVEDAEAMVCDPRRRKRVGGQQSTLMSVADWAIDSFELVWGPEPPPPYGETVSLLCVCQG